MILVTALIACGVVIWRLGRETPALRKEVGQWRGEAGVLTIDDPTKMHAIYRKPYQENTWRWRLYLPGETSYRVCCSANRVPRAGFPERQFVEWNGFAPGGYPTPRGEYELTIALRENPNGGYALAIESKVVELAGENRPWSACESSIDVDQHGASWPEGREGTSETAGNEFETWQESPEGRLRLLRHRVFRDGDVHSKSTEGLMIWMEPMDYQETE